MNDTYLIVVTAFFVGAVAGAILIAAIACRQDPFAAIHPLDNDLLDYLEACECNLYFNDQVDGRSWGVVDRSGKLIAVGRTPRDAIRNAAEKEVDKEVTL